MNNCVEDEFEYNIKRAVKEFVSDFENPKDAIEAIQQDEHIDKFLIYMWDRIISYVDIDELVLQAVEGDYE